MRNLFIFFLLMLFLFFSCSSSPGVRDKQKDIMYLLELTEATKLAAQIVENMIPQVKSMAPDVPDGYWDLFMEEIDLDELISLTIPIYDKYYTHDDILKLIKFYESPIGKKLISTQSAVFADSLKAGEEWGKRIAEKIIKKLQKDGYLTI